MAECGQCNNFKLILFEKKTKIGKVRNTGNILIILKSVN